jgi:hypothetical protein
MCREAAGEFVAGHALGRSARSVRAVEGEWKIQWSTRLRLSTRERMARFVWDSLCVAVAGPVGVLLDVEVALRGRPLPPAERVERLTAERLAAEASMPAVFRVPMRVTTGVVLDGDPESVLLAWTALASAGIWRGGCNVLRATDARQEAGRLLCFPPPTVAEVGAGPPADWLGSPHGPMIGLVRRAEDRAEALLRDRLPAVRRVADALAVTDPRQLPVDQLEQLLPGS